MIISELLRPYGFEATTAGPRKASPRDHGISIVQKAVALQPYSGELSALFCTL